jgi:hypothetical protein
MADEASLHKRRLRYAGTHPRRFEEKYKELNPSLHAEELHKVMQRGQTPAGMHRPICVREILDILHPQPGEVGLDATVGFGGHAQEILARLVPGGRLFGVDVDPVELPRTEARLRSLGKSSHVVARNHAVGPPFIPQRERRAPTLRKTIDARTYGSFSANGGTKREEVRGTFRPFRRPTRRNVFRSGEASASRLRRLASTSRRIP